MNYINLKCLICTYLLLDSVGCSDFKRKNEYDEKWSQEGSNEPCFENLKPSNSNSLGELTKRTVEIFQDCFLLSVLGMGRHWDFQF